MQISRLSQLRALELEVEDVELARLAIAPLTGLSRLRLDSYPSRLRPAELVAGLTNLVHLEMSPVADDASTADALAALVSLTHLRLLETTRSTSAAGYTSQWLTRLRCLEELHLMRDSVCGDLLGDMV